MTRALETRLTLLEARKVHPEQARPVFQFTIASQEDADAVERCSEANPNGLIISRVIVWPPKRDVDGNITAPAYDYRGPIAERTASCEG